MITKIAVKSIAQALKSQKPGEFWNPNKRVQWELDVRAIAHALLQDNPNFNTVEFFTLCKLVTHDSN